MTDFPPGIERVLEHMRKTDGWHVVQLGGRIRRTVPREDPDVMDVESCPLTSPYGAWPGRWRSCGQELGLTPLEALTVMQTADGLGGVCHDTKLRIAMLDAGRIRQPA